MEIIKNWDVVNKVYNNKLLHIKISDKKSHPKISLIIDFIYPDNKRFSIKELVDIIYLSSSRYIEGSLEGAINVKTINTTGGIGVMTTITSSKLVDDYRYVSKGVIFKEEWLIQFTLLSNNLNSFSYKQALQSLFKKIDIF